MSNDVYQNLANTPITPTFLSVEILRDILIPDLLGQDTPAISYWAGKSIAQHFPLSSIEDLITFFQQANFGNLSLVKEKKDGFLFRIEGPVIQSRITTFTEPDFQIEAGFIAATLVQIGGYSAEARATIGRHQTVDVEVITDKSDHIERTEDAEITLQPTSILPTTDSQSTPTKSDNAIEDAMNKIDDSKDDHIHPISDEDQSVTNLPSRSERFQHRHHKR